MKFMGYKRPDGRVGVRNHVLIMPTVVCANQVAESISSLVYGTISFTHQHGCAQLGADLKLTIDTLAGMAINPNVYGVLVVGLGCEAVSADAIAAIVSKTNKPVKVLVIQDVGGTLTATAEGAKIAMDLVQEASMMQRQECDLSEIILGTECGGSDACSGITANPVLGFVSDRLVEAGGTVILAETTELIGAEHILARRAADSKVAEDLYRAIEGAENKALQMGVDMRGSQPAPGNIEGGITSIEEKSLGCVHKAGTSTLREVISYSAWPKENGLVMMDTPGHDIEQLTGMVAGGATVTIFTTGRGTPTGSPIAPTIRLSTNTALFRKMRENMDIDCGGIITGDETIESLGVRVLSELQAVCSGKLTRAELLRHREFGVYRIGPTV